MGFVELTRSAGRDRRRLHVASPVGHRTRAVRLSELSHAMLTKPATVIRLRLDGEQPPEESGESQLELEIIDDDDAVPPPSQPQPHPPTLPAKPVPAVNDSSITQRDEDEDQHEEDDEKEVGLAALLDGDVRDELHDRLQGDRIVLGHGPPQRAAAAEAPRVGGGSRGHRGR